MVLPVKAVDPLPKFLPVANEESVIVQRILMIDRLENVPVQPIDAPAIRCDDVIYLLAIEQIGHGLGQLFGTHCLPLLSNGRVANFFATGLI